MSTVLIGTSGYSYTEWIGPVYAQGTKREEFLAHYAQRFPTVELNFSYYRMPEATQLAAMHKSAPSLQFSIKLTRALPMPLILPPGESRRSCSPMPLNHWHKTKCSVLSCCNSPPTRFTMK